MKAILAQDNVLIQVERPIPSISKNQCLIKVAYAGVNRADLLQRKGLYPPPAGESDILGLEFSGTVASHGSGVNVFQKGDEVCGIVGSGAYAEYVAVDASNLIKVPATLSMEEAAGIAEAFITAFQALVTIAGLEQHERVLIHAGASGVGSAAIQMANALGAEVFVTASTGKHSYCYELGADKCIDYKSVSFDQIVSNVDVVLDLIGASYFQKNIKVLAVEGRMVMLGFLGGVKTGEANIAGIVSKRLRIKGSTLRARDAKYKAGLISGFTTQFMTEDSFPFNANIDRVFPFAQAEEAHKFMLENKNRGKILLKVS